MAIRYVADTLLPRRMPVTNGLITPLDPAVSIVLLQEILYTTRVKRIVIAPNARPGMRLTPPTSREETHLRLAAARSSRANSPRTLLPKIARSISSLIDRKGELPHPPSSSSDRRLLYKAELAWSCDSRSTASPIDRLVALSLPLIDSTASRHRRAGSLRWSCTGCLAQMWACKSSKFLLLGFNAGSHARTKDSPSSPIGTDPHVRSLTRVSPKPFHRVVLPHMSIELFAELYSALLDVGRIRIGAT